MNERVPNGIGLMLEKLIKNTETFDLHNIIRYLLVLLFQILWLHSLLDDDLKTVEKVLECYQQYYHYVYECKLMNRKPRSYAHYLLVANNVADKEE